MDLKQLIFNERDFPGIYALTAKRVLFMMAWMVVFKSLERFVVFVIFTKPGLHFYLIGFIIELGILQSFALVN